MKLDSKKQSELDKENDEYLLYNGFASYFIKPSLTIKVGVAKASLNRAKNKFNEIGPETE